MNSNDLEEMEGNLEDILSKLNDYFELARRKSEHGLASKLISATDAVEGALAELDRVMVNESRLDNIERKRKRCTESVNDAAEELAEVEEPVKIKDVDEITPESDGYGSLGSDAQFLIDEYIGDLARKYYRNGHIPEDEEEEIRDALVPVYVEFEYWAPEDEDNYAGYEDGQMMFIIDRDNGDMCNIDLFNNGGEFSYPDGVRELVEDAAYKYLGITHDKYYWCVPSKG